MSGDNRNLDPVLKKRNGQPRGQSSVKENGTCHGHNGFYSGTSSSSVI